MEDKPNEKNVLAYCDNCENQLSHVCHFDNVNDCNNQDFDTVLETFYQKTDQGNGVSDLIAEQILTQTFDEEIVQGSGVADIIAEQIMTQPQSNYNRRVVVAPTEEGKFVNYEQVLELS